MTFSSKNRKIFSRYGEPSQSCPFTNTWTNNFQEVDLCELTNYKGYVAWGEYPFAFAACLEQEECYR